MKVLLGLAIPAKGLGWHCEAGFWVILLARKANLIHSTTVLYDSTATRFTVALIVIKLQQTTQYCNMQNILGLLSSEQ